MYMRRSVTPRSTLRQMFADLEKGYQSFWGNKVPVQERDRFELMAHRLHEVAEFAISTAAEAAPFDTGKLSDLIGQGDPERLRQFIRRHLVTELGVLQTPGLDPEGTADLMMTGLNGPHPLDRIARETVAQIPGLEAPTFTVFLLEALLREATGLDGRVPERAFSEDLAEANLMQIRFLLDAPGPEYGSTETIKTSGESDPDRVNQMLEASGLAQVGGLSRDLDFHAAVGNITEETVRRISLMMGGEVSTAHSHLIYGLLERVAHATGPQLEISFEDPGPG